MRGLILAAFLGFPIQGAMYTAYRTDSQIWRGEDINDQGHAVGSHKSALYYNGEYTTYAGMLGSGPGRNAWSIFYRINNNDFMVGQSTTSYQNGVAPLRGIVRNADPLVMPLTALDNLHGPAGQSAARGINDLNEIVGEASTPNGTRAVRFEPDGSIVVLSDLGVSSSAADINNLAEVVGHYTDDQGKSRAFFLTQNGILLNIAPESVLQSSALRINESNQVIGNFTTAQGEERGFTFKHNRFDEIPTMGGNFSEALGLNDAGVVVGTARYESGDLAPMVRFPNGQMVDLRKVTDGIEYREFLYRAVAINNRGWVLAWSYRDAGTTYTYVLRPGAITAKKRPEGKIEVRFGAPPGTKVRLEKSTDLKIWNELMQTTIQQDELVHVENASASGFFRGQILE